MTQFFVPLVLCYEEDKLVGVALPLQIRKYIQCSKLSLIKAGVLSRQLAISSPNKIRPFKQRFLRAVFLRKTSNKNQK